MSNDPIKPIEPDDEKPAEDTWVSMFGKKYPQPF
jgi:hypothetical protein